STRFSPRAGFCSAAWRPTACRDACASPWVSRTTIVRWSPHSRRRSVAEAPLFERMALIGVGLIGSSMAHVARRHGLAAHIVGSSQRAETLKKAHKVGFCDSLTLDPVEAARDADLVVLGTPVGAFGEIARAIAPALKPGAVLTDVGSVKVAVVR